MCLFVCDEHSYLVKEHYLVCCLLNYIENSQIGMHKADIWPFRICKELTDAQTDR